MREALKDFMVEQHIGVFTWSHEDMPRIDNVFIELSSIAFM